MSSYWESARRILSGKPKGSKLIVLGVFLITSGAGMQLAFPLSTGGITGGMFFFMTGFGAFIRGMNLYEMEMRYDLEKRYKPTS